jgi:CRP-like cAMP-binding protein
MTPPKGPRDNPLLCELKAQLHELEATIKHCQSERFAVHEQIALERARIQEEQARAQAGLVNNVLARWEQDMTAPDIAKALRCTQGEVQRILNAWRKQEGVKIRRGRKVRERRTTR